MVRAKMTYFKFHGLGEPVRFMLAFTGTEWDETLVDVEDFPGLKDSYPFGKLPVLELDGQVVHQSAAILRYLARKAGGLYGSSEMDALQCDVAYDTISDLRMILLSYFYEPHPESQAAKKQLVLTELVPMYLRNLEELVAKNGGYFVGGQLTWVDVAFGGLIDYMSHMAERDLVADRPSLRALRDRVLALPAIQKHLATRRTFAY